MTNAQITILILGIVTMTPIIVMTVFLLTGKGSWLIAGFNTSSKEKRDKYDKSALCKFIGKALAFIDSLVIGVFTGAFLGNLIILIVCTALILATIIFVIIFANTKNRFIKKTDY